MICFFLSAETSKLLKPKMLVGVLHLPLPLIFLPGPPILVCPCRRGSRTSRNADVSTGSRPSTRQHGAPIPSGGPLTKRHGRWGQHLFWNFSFRNFEAFHFGTLKIYILKFWSFFILKPFGLKPFRPVSYLDPPKCPHWFAHEASE